MVEKIYLMICDMCEKDKEKVKIGTRKFFGHRYISVTCEECIISDKKRAKKIESLLR